MKSSATSLLTSAVATIADIEIIATIISACSTRLKSRQLPDWSNYYSLPRLAEKLKTQSAFIFCLESIPVGVVFVSDKDLYYYNATDISQFTGKNSPALYISTLAVSPEYQHRGFASQIIQFCEELTIQKNIKYLRLDCNGQDGQLVGFYQKRGFSVVSPMVKEPLYLLMEKCLLAK